MADNTEAMKKYIEKYWQTKIDKAINAAIPLVIKEVTADIEKIYQEKVVDEFYDGYDPMFYHRRRSLESLMEISSMGSGQNSVLKLSFNPSAMTLTHVGPNKSYSDDTLYNTVFKEGFHGGASIGGTGRGYRYRTPYPFYSRWGSYAKMEDKSPFDRIKEELQLYEKTTGPDKMAQIVRSQLK